MHSINRLLISIAFALGLAAVASASTPPAVKVFEGTVAPRILPVAGDRVDALAFGPVSGPGIGLIEFDAGAEFGLSPLGDDVTTFFPTIFESSDLVLDSRDLLGAPRVMAGPTADAPFIVTAGTILGRFQPE
ncbi:hypothetical protein [Rubrimonas sp.]|uniref:hypothetical protein n=1 Tax=Rubrimonas sp. TaxID=2036015 RepID=UPI002FDD3941